MYIFCIFAAITSSDYDILNLTKLNNFFPEAKMKFNFTARHFKAAESLIEFAEGEAEKLNKYYDGLMKCNMILSSEKSTSNIKSAEVIVTANTHHVFTGKAKADDFRLSIERAFGKVRIQLKKFKEKLKSNHPRKIRAPRVNEIL